MSSILKIAALRLAASLIGKLGSLIDLKNKSTNCDEQIFNKNCSVSDPHQLRTFDLEIKEERQQDDEL